MNTTGSCKRVRLALFLLALTTTQVQAAAVRALSGFTGNILPANDDGSTARVSIGFSVDFYGTNFNSCFVNNNGNITFDRSLGTFTPFGLTSTVSQIIAPFFGDVDTRGSGSGLVTYGNDRVDGRLSFGVNWVNVGYFGSHVDRLNSFQLVLINRADVSPNSFDIEFNYDRIQWETGDASGGSGGLGGNPARVGYSNGSTESGTFFELPGSGISGAFLDGNAATALISHSLNSAIPGRYLFRVRGGRVDFGGLSLTKSANTDLVGIGSNLTFSIRFSNSSTGTVLNAVLTDAIPANATYVSATTSNGTCTVSNGVVTCNLGDVLPGATADATVTVTPTQIGDLCNEASVTSSNRGTLTDQACVSVLPQRIHNQCITRSARYWFTHVQGDDQLCASLLEAIRYNGQVMNLGFLGLPVDFHNGDGQKDAIDALIETLGLFWRNSKWTGDPDGTQSSRQLASPLCRARKALAVEIVAAQANTIFLNTYPTDCRYSVGRTMTNFPIDVVQQARSAAAGENLDTIRVMTALLRKFNNNGITNNFFGGFKECAAEDNKTLKSESRDPTTRLTCPGMHDSCDTAEAILSVPFSETVNLTQMADRFRSPGCGIGGANAVWKIAPPVSAPGRNFVVRTKGSNLPALVSVWQGGANCDSVNEIACSGNTDGSTPSSHLQFTTDGTNTYFIVIEGQGGQVGRLKMKVTSF